MKLLKAIVGLGALPLCLTAQEVVKIGFEGFPILQPGQSILLANHWESGVSISVWNDLYIRKRSGDPFAPDNGNTYLVSLLPRRIQISSNTGLFGLVALDLAEYSSVVPDPAKVEFTGFRNDGTIVYQTFITDGVIDGTGPIEDFQTFSFGPEFNDLVRVEIDSHYFSGCSFDNLVVAIPEPGAASLAGLGLLGWHWRSRRHGRLES